MTTTKRRADFVLLLELADALREHPDTRCSLVVEEDERELRVTFAVPRYTDTETAFIAAELAQRLGYLAGMGQVRAFAAHFGIDSERLEPLLRPAEQRSA